MRYRNKDGDRDIGTRRGINRYRQSVAVLDQACCAQPPDTSSIRLLCHGDLLSMVLADQDYGSPTVIAKVLGSLPKPVPKGDKSVDAQRGV